MTGQLGQYGRVHGYYALASDMRRLLLVDLLSSRFWKIFLPEMTKQRCKDKDEFRISSQAP